MKAVTPPMKVSWSSHMQGIVGAVGEVQSVDPWQRPAVGHPKVGLHLHLSIVRILGVVLGAHHQGRHRDLARGGR